MADMIKMTFNGREIETEAGTPLIRLSVQQGEKIPHFCYHPGIGVDGNCRMCLVELEGVPKLVAGCTLKAAEGMKITTNSEKVIKAREGVLEFILINHPLDCPICDKGGECPLQDVTREHGAASGRMTDSKNQNVKHKAFGEHIIFDAERCILCSRCLRYQRDVVGREELGIANRGDRATISLFGDRELTSGFTGNLADICPVGALTSRAFRFQARPWELKAVDTSCGGCSLGCATRAWWKGETVKRLTSRRDAAVNDWWICDKGRFTYLDQTGCSENLVQRQGVSVPVTRSEAASRSRELLAEPGSAVLAGSLCTDEELTALADLNESLGATSSPFPAPVALLDFMKQLADSGLELEDLNQLDRFERAIVLGADPELSHPIFGLRLTGAGAAVTLVQQGEFAPPGDVTRRWRRVETDPASWLAGEGAAELAGDDPLLLVLTEAQILAGALSTSGFETLAGRGGLCRVLVLLEGMNRRGLLNAAAAQPADRGDLLAALESGSLNRLLVFGVDPATDLADRDRWERVLGEMGGLIMQSGGLAGLHAAAAVVLARRSPVDLVGTITNTCGLPRRLESRRQTAGRRAMDTDWFGPLLASVPASAGMSGDEG
jgi:predicted molibdopterin-dependent oxidoreductase YjgC